MSFVLHGLLLSSASKAAAKPASNSFGFIFIILIFVGGYFLLIRPQRQRARKVQATQQTIAVGDEVMLTSGIIGRVTWLEGDRARLEIAPGTEIEVIRAAIGRQLTQPLSDEDIAEQPEDDSHYGDNPYVEPRSDLPDPTAAESEHLPGESAPGMEGKDGG
ncbi:MAG: preprotein translocase subunit YajC [Acidimicrobiales bacterium]